MLCRRQSEHSPKFNLQWKEYIVVVADDPPQFRSAKIFISDKVTAVALDHGVKHIVRPGRGIQDRCEHEEHNPMNAACRRRFDYFPAR